MALPIAIVEDQTLDAQRLEELLQQQLPEAECTWFTCGDDFLRTATEPGLYAVVFLDICMAGTNGIETARRLRQADPEVLIVFVTSSPEYVWDAFPVHPFDYLLKPYQEEKFEHLAAELRRALRCKEPELEIRIARQSIQLPLCKVLYAIARNHYVLITTEDGEYRAMCSFAQIEEKLTARENFMSCNRGVIINMDKVLRFGEDCIEILDGTCLPVRQKDKCTCLPTLHSTSSVTCGRSCIEERSSRHESCPVRPLFSGFCTAVPQRVSVSGIPVGKAAHPQTHCLHCRRVHHPACASAAPRSAPCSAEQQFSLPAIVLVSFWLLRWRVTPEVTVSQTVFLFSVSAVMMAVCSLLAMMLLNARAELSNPQTVCLASTALLRLGLAAVLTVLFWFTAVQWSRWLLREYSGEAFWQSAWPLPALYAVFLVYCMPLNPAVVLVGRLKIISVLAVSISLFGIFLLLYEMYRVAREFARNARLDRENQLLAMESRRYMELQTYLDNTRRLRHDFRQHLHVIAGLTETGQLEELKSYLRQYESELSEHRPSLCANAAVDALAGYYDHAAGQQGVPVEWKLALPRQLPMPEADLCTILGNLLENALHASQKLPPEQRRVQVMAQMLSPAMLGLVVENRYDGMLKKQQGILRSTKHEGTGIGLVSAETVVHKYNGSLHLETEEQIFRVNVLLNL